VSRAQNRAFGSLPYLFYFFMRRMLPAAVAEFLQFQPLRHGLPILGRRIISFLALTALQRNNFSWHKTAPGSILDGASGVPARHDGRETPVSPLNLLLHDFADGSCAYRMPAFADREAQAFFHGHRRDQFDYQADVVTRHNHFCARW
jgi:hypothetical protein